MALGSRCRRVFRVSTGLAVRGSRVVWISRGEGRGSAGYLDSGSAYVCGDRDEFGWVHPRRERQLYGGCCPGDDYNDPGERSGACDRTTGARQSSPGLHDPRPPERNGDIFGYRAGTGADRRAGDRWDDNFARAAIVLPPAPHRFAFARAHRLVPRAGTFQMKVTPNPRGRRLVAHPRYRVTLRLWVSYTPTGGRTRILGFYGLHLKR